MAADPSKSNPIDTSEVVLRKGRRRSSQLSAGEERLKDAIERDLYRKKTRSMAAKRVQWSETTDFREKVKEYRRSQLCITLDYQHIAVEEEREREGVKKWREMKNTTSSSLDEVEEKPEEKEPPTPTGDADSDEDEDEEYEDDLSDFDSDDGGDCDEVLETQLRVIKAKTTRLTLLPAYTDAVPVYEGWLADETNTSQLPPDRLSVMTSQLALYKEVLDLYGQWDENDDTDKVDANFNTISSKLMDANELGDPPPPVEKAIAAILQSEVVIHKQKSAYNAYVDEMVTSLSKNLQATSI